MVYKRPHYFEGQIETAIPPRRRVYAGRESSPTTSQQRLSYGITCKESNQVQYSSIVEDGLKDLRIRSQPTKGNCRSEWTIDFDVGGDVELVVHDWKRHETQLRLSPTRSRAVRQTPQYSSSSTDVDTEDLEDFGETETSDSSTSSGYSSVSSQTRDQYSPTPNYQICSQMDPMCVPRHSHCKFQNANRVPMTFRRLESEQRQRIKAGCRPCSRSPPRTRTYLMADILPSPTRSRSRAKICSKTGLPSGCARGRGCCQGQRCSQPCRCSQSCERDPQDSHRCAGHHQMAAHHHHHCSHSENPTGTVGNEEDSGVGDVVWSRKVYAKADSEQGSSIFDGPVFENAPVNVRPPGYSRIVATGDLSDTSDTYTSTTEVFDHTCGSLACGTRYVPSARGQRRFNRLIEPPTTKMKNALERWLSEATDITLASSELDSDLTSRV
ncbi:hypothetical protein SprV_0200882900 [Sparganum proliferum]